MVVSASVKFFRDTALYGFISSGISDGVTVAGVSARRYVDLLSDPGDLDEPVQTILRTISRTDGSFRFDTIPLGQKYIVIGYEERARPVFNDVVRGPIEPFTY